MPLSGNKTESLPSEPSAHYTPEQLLGKSVVILANLPTRKMMGLESQGMILAAEGSDGKLSVLFPDKGINPGSLIS